MKGFSLFLSLSRSSVWFCPGRSGRSSSSPTLPLSFPGSPSVPKLRANFSRRLPPPSPPIPQGAAGSALVPIADALVLFKRRAKASFAPFYFPRPPFPTASGGVKERGGAPLPACFPPQQKKPQTATHFQGGGWRGERKTGERFPQNWRAPCAKEGKVQAEALSPRALVCTSAPFLSLLPRSGSGRPARLAPAESERRERRGQAGYLPALACASLSSGEPRAPAAFADLKWSPQCPTRPPPKKNPALQA